MNKIFRLLVSVSAYLWSALLALLALSAFASGVVLGGVAAGVFAVALTPFVQRRFFSSFQSNKFYKVTLGAAYVASFLVLGGVSSSINGTTNQENVAKSEDSVSTEKPLQAANPSPVDYAYNLAHNLDNLELLLRCTRLKGNSKQRGEVYWVGMNANSDNTTKFRFPYYKFISDEANKHEIILKEKSSILFYENELQPGSFAEELQYGASVSKTTSSYKFRTVESVAGANYSLDEYSIMRDTGVLKTWNEKYALRNEYQCNPVPEIDKAEIFSRLYDRVHKYTVNKYNEVQARFDKEIRNRKF